uniref:Gustatory receptor n=1 Tax=Anopheles coluzzii TaxID=1518534 RepID=A0A6E8VPF3_ANOCL
MHAELQFLNIFNYCFVSPTYLHLDSLTNRYEFQCRNVYWMVTLLAVLVTCSFSCATFLMLEILRNHLASVMTTTTILLYMMRYLVMVPHIMWILLYRGRLKHDCAFALSIVQEKDKRLFQMPKLADQRRKRKTLQLYWVQIGCIVVSLLLGSVVQSYTLWSIASASREHLFGYYLFNLLALVVMIFISLMHLMYAQCWALLISFYLEELVWITKSEHLELGSLRTVIALWDDLTYFKQRVASTFGIMNVLHLLDILITCATESYAIIYFYEFGFNLLGALLSVVILVLCTGDCFLFAYAHDLVEVKEAELKDALKSMQYTNLKRQSRDQKDFYDLVNLKLMMESPKITACGLFEINLQIFYNVFAAIITYIVILFQFRGFEKSP